MRARWAGLVVLALALAGCGGIPTSGDVKAGEVIDEETLPEVTYRALGPQVGATPLEIVGGFIAAATNPQDDYAVARSFLDESIRGVWEPDEITQIRTGVAVPRAETDTTFTYSLTSGAYVNNRGQYIEDDPASQVLEFSVVQDENEEWRINAAPDGIVLSQEVFDTIFDAYPLYFFDPSNRYLIPDVRWFPKTTGLSTRIVRALLAGQSAYLGQGVNTYFPASTALNSSVSIDSAVATVDLTEPVLDASPEQSERMVQQLRASISNVSEVVLTVNGVPIDVPTTSGQAPVINPQVETPLLVRQDDTFGFLRANGSVSALAGQAAEIVQLGAVDAVLARDQEASAVLAPDGVHVVFGGNTPARLLDSRAGLIAPAIDNDGFVWTVPAGDASAIRAFDADGNAYAIDGSQFAGRAVSLTISRDGARVLMLVDTDLGPRLYVAGIIRQDGVPIQLAAEPRSLRMPADSAPIDATWVDDHTVATLTSSAAVVGTTVTLYQLGGPSISAGRIADGVALVGGNGALDGLRVLTADGNVFLPRGNGWADTSTRVTFIATQQ